MNSESVRFLCRGGRPYMADPLTSSVPICHRKRTSQMTMKYIVYYQIYTSQMKLQVALFATIICDYLQPVFNPSLRRERLLIMTIMVSNSNCSTCTGLWNFQMRCLAFQTGSPTVTLIGMTLFQKKDIVLTGTSREKEAGSAQHLEEEKVLKSRYLAVREAPCR